MSIIRLLTEGGTPLEAMHKYDPICERVTFVIVKLAPSTLLTATNPSIKNNHIDLIWILNKPLNVKQMK